MKMSGRYDTVATDLRWQSKAQHRSCSSLGVSAMTQTFSGCWLALSWGEEDPIDEVLRKETPVFSGVRSVPNAYISPGAKADGGYMYLAQGRRLQIPLDTMRDLYSEYHGKTRSF